MNEVKSPYMQQSPDNGEDLISRQDAIALCDKPITPTGNGDYDNAREWERESIKDDLLSLPPAEPKHGEWIFNPKDAIESMFTKPKCSECGFESSDGGNFCPNCGSDMRKGSDTE